MSHDGADGAKGDNRAICGIYGAAHNSAGMPASAYGGYFLKLLARGLYVGIRAVSAGTFLTDTDTFVFAAPALVFR